MIGPHDSIIHVLFVLAVALNFFHPFVVMEIHAHHTKKKNETKKKNKTAKKKKKKND